MGNANDSIDLNGRTVALADVVAGHIAGATDFERHALGFIRAWQTGADRFTLHTSGSTGAPKPVVVTRGQMIASAKATALALGLQPGWSALITLDTQFIAGKMMIVRSLVTGMRMVLREPRGNPLELLPENLPVDFAALVPYQVETLLQSPQATRLGRIHTIIVGGAPLRVQAAQQVAGLPCRVYATYGMTETLSHVALQRIDLHTEAGVFETLPGITLEADSRGCLVLGVPYLAEKVVTNDRVEIISEKKFKWLGRWDNVINSGGYKVNPETIEFQIEKIFHRFEIPNRFFVAGLPDLKLGKKVTLFVEGNENEKLRLSIDEAIKTIASGVERPRSVVFLPAFVDTATQKLNRSATVSGYLR